ncbi:DNA topoisomerase IV alpha subunit [Scleroderma citrinum]
MECIESFALDILEKLVGSTSRSNELTPPFTGTFDDPQSRYGRLEIAISCRRREGSDRRILRYPMGARTPSSRRIAQLLCVMNHVHQALDKGVSLTKRDLYYRDVALFRSQTIVDRLIDDLAATLKQDRADLNIRATSKGLICGSGLLIHLVEGGALRLNDCEGTLIPPGENIARFEIEGPITWVLVVEKEAIFQTLCKLQFTKYPTLPGRGLIITGKGYPDLATRQMVKALSDHLPNIPIVALVDSDAYGLDIMSVYKYGSQGLRHENEKLAAHRIEWLGIRASELSEFDIDLDMLIPITKHDEKKVHILLISCPA